MTTIGTVPSAGDHPDVSPKSGDGSVEESGQVRTLRHLLARTVSEHDRAMIALRDSQQQTIVTLRQQQSDQAESYRGQLDSQRRMYVGMLDTERVRTQDAYKELEYLRQLNRSKWYHCKQFWQLLFG